MFFYRSPYRHREILPIAKSSINPLPNFGMAASPRKAFLPQ